MKKKKNWADRSEARDDRDDAAHPRDRREVAVPAGRTRPRTRPSAIGQQLVSNRQQSARGRPPSRHGDDDEPPAIHERAQPCQWVGG